MESSARVRIWDLPTRLFHWLLAVLVIFSFVTGKLGSLEWHFQSGYAITTLLLFRLLWGFVGTRYARFASFQPSLAAAMRTLRFDNSRYIRSAGHSELGTLSVYALLVIVLIQAGTGLFTNDGTFTEGPWAKFVSGAASDRLSTVHRYNTWLVAALAFLHVAAIAYYLLARRDDLITPMVTGDKLGVTAVAAEDGATVRLRAAVLAALCAVVVYYLVT